MGTTASGKRCRVSTFNQWCPALPSLPPPSDLTSHWRVFLLFLLFHPLDLYCEALSCRAATGQSSLCAHLPLSPSRCERLATVPTDGAPFPSGGPFRASRSQIETWPDPSHLIPVHIIKRKKGFLVLKFSRTGLDAVTNSFKMCPFR